MGDQLQKRVGRKVRLLRVGKSLSQEDLAVRLGFQQTYISRIELGKCNLTLSNIQILAKAFGVDPCELLR